VRLSQGLLAACLPELIWPAVEGLAYAFSRQAGLLIVGAELAVFVVRCGVRMPLRVAVGTFFAAGTLRAGHCLVMVSRAVDQNLTACRCWQQWQNGPVKDLLQLLALACPPARLPAWPHPSPLPRLQSFRHSGAWRVRQLEDLSSIWDWEPPGSDAKQSSAWHILRQLAVTANK
jgi:hypothetical protein